MIPRPLLEDKQLGLIAQHLFGYIYWLCHLKKEKCIASNQTLADLVGTSPRVIQNALTDLENGGYVTRIFADEVGKKRLEIIPRVSFRGDTLSPTGRRGVTHRSYPLSPTGDQNKKSNKEEKRGRTRTLNFDTIDLQDFKDLDEFKKKDIDLEYRKAKDWLSSSGKRYKDYPAFFRNWLRRVPDTIKPKIEYKTLETTREEINPENLKKFKELRERILR